MFHKVFICERLYKVCIVRYNIQKQRSTEYVNEIF